MSFLPAVTLMYAVVTVAMVCFSMGAEKLGRLDLKWKVECKISFQLGLKGFCTLKSVLRVSEMNTKR